MTTIAEPSDVSNGKTGKTLRERARAAVEEAEANRQRREREQRAEEENRARAGLLHHLSTWLELKPDPASVFGNAVKAEGCDAKFLPRVEIDGLTFGWECDRGYGSRLFLCAICPMCSGVIVSSGNIQNFVGLADHIEQIDAYASGAKPCPACEYRRKEEAEARAEVVAPPPPPPTQADRLHQLVREIAEEVVEERWDGQS